MPQATGPDCICVGLARAGTGWLFRQLDDHPAFWMPPIKEIDYLDRPTPKLRAVTARLTRLSSGAGRARDTRDRDFLAAAAELAGRPRDVERYMALFRFKGEAMSGDITPSYARLDDAPIREIAARMPGVKIMFLVRDPIECAWSRISMQHRNGKFDVSLVDDRGALLDYLRTSDTFGDASCPTQIVARWARVAPGIPFRHFFFDDLVERPAWLRGEILGFLGADPDDSKGRYPVEVNHKADRGPKLALTAAAREAMVEHYRDELGACGERFGDYGRGWAARYGL